MSSSVFYCPSPVTFVAAIPISTLTVINSETSQGSEVTAQLPATTVTKEQSKRFFLQTRQYIWIIDSLETQPSQPSTWFHNSKADWL